MSKLIRALTTLVEDLTMLVGRGRKLVISITLLALAIAGSISLL